MLQLLDFEFLYESVAIDLNRHSCWRISWLVGLWNQLAIVSTINLNWVYFSSLIALTIWHCHNPDTFSFSCMVTRLWLIGIWYPDEIISVIVTINLIVISRHFADAISSLKSSSYLARRLYVVTCRKRVIHEIPYVKFIRNCKSHNSVKQYAHVWPCA